MPQPSSPPHAALKGLPVCQAGTSPGPLGAESAPRSPSSGSAASAWLEVGRRALRWSWRIPRPAHDKTERKEEEDLRVLRQCLHLTAMSSAHRVKTYSKS